MYYWAILILIIGKSADHVSKSISSMLQVENELWVGTSDGLLVLEKEVETNFQKKFDSIFLDN